MNLRMQVVLWALLVGAGALCMAGFLAAGYTYLGWFDGAPGARGEALETRQWLQLFLVMPAGLCWMTAIFPAMQIHFLTGHKAVLAITAVLVAADLVALVAGSMAI